MSLFTPNTDNFSNYYDKAKFLMAWRISLLFVLIFTSLIIIFSKGDPKALTCYIITLFIVIVLSSYLIKIKNYKVIFWSYAISGTLISHFAINYVVNCTHYVDFLWMLTSILLAFVGLGKKEGIIFIVINAIGIAYFLGFSINDQIKSIVPSSNLKLIGDYIEILFAFFVIAYLLHQYLIFNEYTESKLKESNHLLEVQNKLVTAKNNENITLFKEVHHRVKNNLQIIISLLRLQKGELKSDEAKRHFSEAINRIMVMSLIHKKLYQQHELAEIEIKSYLTDLSNDIKSLSDLGLPVHIQIDSEIKNVGLKTVVPLGLLINELLTNSIKHAFFKKKEGWIKINILKENQENFKLIYSDNGEWRNSKSNFGLELVSILTSQLEGKHERISNEEGTTYTFTLKNIDLEK